MATKRTNTRNGNIVLQCSQARKKCKWCVEIVPTSGGTLNWDSPEAHMAHAWTVKDTNGATHFKIADVNDKELREDYRLRGPDFCNMSNRYLYFKDCDIHELLSYGCPYIPQSYIYVVDKFC